jgi:transposase InsO family protein
VIDAPLDSCQLAPEAFPWDAAPRYLIPDRDRIYGSVVTRRLRTMGIRDKPTAPASPWQNGFVERPIGSIRRECVDHIIVLGEMHLRRVLKSYEIITINSIRIGHWICDVKRACRPCAVVSGTAPPRNLFRMRYATPQPTSAELKEQQ